MSCGLELLSIDLQVNVNLRSFVELADGFGLALVPVVLRIDFVIYRGEAGETVGAFLADDVRLHRVSAGIGQVDDGAGDRIILLIKHFTEQQAPLLFFFLVGHGVSCHGY